MTLQSLSILMIGFVENMRVLAVDCLDDGSADACMPSRLAENATACSLIPEFTSIIARNERGLRKPKDNFTDFRGIFL